MNLRNKKPDDLMITGIGVTTAIGQGKQEFLESLLAGRHAFGVMKRPHRQYGATNFIGAEIQQLRLPENLSRKVLNHASFTGQVALATLTECWHEAQLGRVDPERIALIVGGSNIQQRSMVETYAKYWDNPHFIRPNYGIAYMDTDICGLCSQELGIHGLAYTVGGASASGHLAILQAIQLVQSGQVDACIAMGALADLSHFEIQALRSLGAMGSDRFGSVPGQACRPFDTDHDGFIFGEGCACIVVERRERAEARNVQPYAAITGWSMSMDGNRNANPNHNSEVKVIRRTLQKAELAAGDVDYVNPHGTASKLGDEIELGALRACGLDTAKINTTKSITGHGLCAAGTVEVAATLLQMRARRLHPCLNMEHPMDESFPWVGPREEDHDMVNALNLSFGFGGINTALSFANPAAY